MTDPRTEGTAGEAESPLLRGAIDLHLHSGPDVFPRRMTAMEAAVAAQRAGMGALLFKSHSTDTAARAEMVTASTGFPTFGGVVLNYAVGGLNPHAVTESVRQGGRCVWMPTIGARHFIAHADGAPMLKAAIPPDVDGLVISHGGRLLTEAERILDIVAEHQILLAGGHLAPDELEMLFVAGNERGIERMVCNHGEEPFMAVNLPQLRRLADLGAYIEITKIGLIEDRAQLIRQIGVERCFVSTDGGPMSFPDPITILRDTVDGLARLGFTEAEIRYLVADVPAYLLQLSASRPRLGAGRDASPIA
jgi:Family of unknown function (DUF6282)